MTMNITIQISEEKLKNLFKEAVTEVLRENGIIKENSPERAPEKDIITKDLRETPLHTSIVNILHRNNINTVEDLLRYSREAINSIRGMGYKKLIEIDAYLKDHNLEYGQLPPKYYIQYHGEHSWAIKDTQNSLKELPQTCKTFQEAEEFMNDLIEKGHIESWMKEQ